MFKEWYNWRGKLWLQCIHFNWCPSIFYHSVNIWFAPQLLLLKLYGCSRGTEKKTREQIEEEWKRNSSGYTEYTERPWSVRLTRVTLWIFIYVHGWGDGGGGVGTIVGACVHQCLGISMWLWTSVPICLSLSAMLSNCRAIGVSLRLHCVPVLSSLSQW